MNTPQLSLLIATNHGPGIRKHIYSHPVAGTHLLSLGTLLFLEEFQVCVAYICFFGFMPTTITACLGLSSHS